MIIIYLFIHSFILFSSVLVIIITLKFNLRSFNARLTHKCFK